MSKGEVWKDITGFEGLYKVSDRGNIYSVERISSQGKKIGGRTLKPGYGGSGYLKVGLYKNGTRESKLIHRLVLEAFVENPNNLPVVNHLDEVKDNNELSNLEWCTSEYNNSYGTRIEKVSKKTSNKIRAVNVETGEVVKFNSTHEAGRKGYNRGSVSSACRGVYKDGVTGKLIGGDGRTYKGYKWYYQEEGESS